MNHSPTAAARRRLQPSFVTSSANTWFKHQQPSANRIQHGQTVEIKHAGN